MTTRSNARYVVSARNDKAGGILYFDGAGDWTADLNRAHVARSVVGRNALLRVASALSKGNSVVAPELTRVITEEASQLPLAA